MSKGEMSLLAEPFLKWAGGKRELACKIASYFPKHIDTYYEPFLGGGAVFWFLALNKRFKNAVLNDSNRELMDCYRVVRDFPDELIIVLKDLEAKYNEAGASVDTARPFYEHWRDLNPQALDPVSRAARTILLNKTGFNGLYRVNLHGVFNVSWSKRKRVSLFSEARIWACSATLNDRVTLLSVDFTHAAPATEEFDVIYFDPPYLPTSRTASFTGYTGSGFNRDDHYTLRSMFERLVDQGTKVVLSNVDLPEVREMYNSFEQYEIQAARAINSDGAKRGPVGELIIVGRHASAKAPGPP